MKWPLVRLGDCCNIVSGATPKTGIDNYWGGSILWATPKDVSNLDAPWLTDTPDKITEAGYASCSTQMLPAGTVLVTSRAPIGNIAIAAKPMCTNQGFKSLVPGPTVHSGYLYHCMKANSDRLQALGNGATFKEVSKPIVENFEIPLPPLEEQKRISAILDKADSLRRKRQQAILLAEDFLRAVFLDMFGDPVCKAGDRVSLAEVIDIDAPMVDPRLDEYADMPHVGPDRIEKDTGRLMECQTAREEGLISKKFLFDDSYVLYSKIRPYLRKCALATFTGLCSADMYPVRPKVGVATREFIWALLLSNEFDRYVASLPDRANIPKLNRDELNAFEFNLPSIQKQEKFSAIVQKRIAYTNLLDCSYSNAVRLANSLQAHFL